MTEEIESEFHVQCPYCGEEATVYFEPDLMGTLVQDCEVCCRPWMVQIGYDQGERYVMISRGDGE